MIGAVLAVLVALLAVGALTGRVRARSCCAIADPERDLRMRSAFTDPQAVDAPELVDGSVDAAEDNVATAPHDR